MKIQVAKTMNLADLNDQFAEMLLIPHILIRLLNLLKLELFRVHNGFELIYIDGTVLRIWKY